MPATRVKAGPLRWRIQIQRLPRPQTAPRDSYGSILEDATQWQTIATVWAAIRPLHGRELWHAQQVQADVSCEIEIRYLRGLNPKDRFRLLSSTGKERIFNIDGIIDVDERHRRILVNVKEVL